MTGCPLRPSTVQRSSSRWRRSLRLNPNWWAADLIGLTTADFRKLFGLQKGFYTDLVLEVRNKREVATVATKIKQRLPDTRPILRDEILRTYEAIFDWRSGLLVFILAGAVFAFLIFAWDKATSLSFEERREIGILKAVGWETSEVIAMKSWGSRCHFALRFPGGNDRGVSARLLRLLYLFRAGAQRLVGALSAVSASA